MKSILIKIIFGFCIVFSMNACHTFEHQNIFMQNNNKNSIVEVLDKKNKSSKFTFEKSTKNSEMAPIEMPKQTQTVQKLALQKQVKIHLGLLDSNNSLIDGTYLLFDGRIKEFNIDENTNQSIINLTCASNFADFDLTLGRSTNETSQQRFFSGDRGFQYAGVTVREIRWGRA